MAFIASLSISRQKVRLNSCFQTDNALVAVSKYYLVRREYQEVIRTPCLQSHSPLSRHFSTFSCARNVGVIKGPLSPISHTSSKSVTNSSATTQPLAAICSNMQLTFSLCSAVSDLAPKTLKGNKNIVPARFVPFNAASAQDMIWLACEEIADWGREGEGIEWIRKGG